jgi:biotin carboxylase
MGDTTARYFRDKLAMRTRAREAGIPVPDFIHILNYKKLTEFLTSVPFPLIIKPRLQAGAHGIKKIYNENEFWTKLAELGDEQSFYLLEQFIPGNIYHVDSIIYEKEIKFSIASQYGLPPFEIAHEGRVFSSRTIDRNSEDAKNLLELNKKVLNAMGLLRGVSHTEFIKSHSEGKFYFLETSARVGGANIAELVEAASGINLWAEWAKIEVMQGKKEYILPRSKNNYAGIVISLARQEWPDLSNYNSAEIVWKMYKKNHAGIIFTTEDSKKLEDLLLAYTERFYNDFFASVPMTDKPSN